MAGIIARPAVFFGKIITSDVSNAVKVCIDKYMMDTRLTMYFKDKAEVYAQDKKKECNEGDYVILKEVPESEYLYLSNDIKVKYDVQKLIYKSGYMVDPITQKRNASTEYIDDIRRTTELFGYSKPYLRTTEKYNAKE